MKTDPDDPCKILTTRFKYPKELQQQPEALPHQSTFKGYSTRMAGDRMSLCWNKFEETAASAFRYLGDTGDFSDVTLASEDGKQVGNSSL